MIEINPGNPAVPNAIALTLKKAIYAEPIPDPTIAPIKGYLSFKLTPNIAGSVIPSNAEIPAADATPFNFLFCLIIKNAAIAAPPCATLDIVAIGNINDPPVFVASAINVVSTAIKL